MHVRILAKRQKLCTVGDNMRKYIITAFIGFDRHSKIVEAKNSFDANQKALDYGHKL